MLSPIPRLMYRLYLMALEWDGPDGFIRAAALHLLAPALEQVVVIQPQPLMALRADLPTRVVFYRLRCSTSPQRRRMTTFFCAGLQQVKSITIISQLKNHRMDFHGQLSPRCKGQVTLLLRFTTKALIPIRRPACRITVSNKQIMTEHQKVFHP